ncbi:Na(+)/H(+) antiporter 1 [Nosema granulosis]|uniref:Na(+)/H(+) antiporter 1 n=1 Tax=Nosema granulosis TaxID=83296 RepID=A0A9P6L098_9MICR|nr:Na(+)/H(+) antiporter 1 [Nosema granulosis]
MNDIYTIILVLSTFVLFYSLVSKFIKDILYLPESLISMVFGILIGPYVLNVLKTSNLISKIFMYNISRVILCIQTMSVALSLPRYYILEKWQSLFVLVVCIGIIKCLVTTGIVYLIGRYDIALSWSLAACLTPTDPILSSSIVKGKFASRTVPRRIRILLSAESGVNDGLGIILLFIGVDINTYGIKEGVKIFLIDNLAIKVFVSAIFGLCIGTVTKACFKYCYSRKLIGMESFMSHTFLLVLLSLGLMEYIGGSELICIFFCGSVFSSDEWLNVENRNSSSQDLMDNLLSTSFFVFFGSRIDFGQFTLLTIISSLLILIFRRPLICFLMYRHVPELRTKKEGLFVGWFGPIGVGAIYYALLVDKTVGSLTINYASVVVFFSVLIHGLTVPLYALYSQYFITEQNRNSLI